MNTNNIAEFGAIKYEYGYGKIGQKRLIWWGYLRRMEENCNLQSNGRMWTAGR